MSWVDMKQVKVSRKAEQNYIRKVRLKLFCEDRTFSMVHDTTDQNHVELQNYLYGKFT